MSDTSFVQDLAVILLSAGLAAWVFRAIGLSSVVGCILAGVLIGPHTPFFPTISDPHRIEAIAQVGLVFIMFWIGLGFSLQRLRRLGFHTLIANVIGAFLLFHFFRFIGGVMGWSPMASLFLAAMTMVSSSAIIMKTLIESGVNHEKTAQRALTITIGEDAVVIILLTMLASTVHLGSVGTLSLATTLGVLALFITLFLIAGLSAIPRSLSWLRKSADSETTTIIITGFIFLFALLSFKAGYSLALGAFLLGAIVADTPSKNKVERLLSGLYFLFSSVFFTAIGMLIIPESLKAIWPQILILSGLIIIMRIGVYSLGLVIIGNKPREALNTSLYITPIGEFSFIIASLGISMSVLKNDSYALAVGICFITALTSPLLARNAETISTRVVSALPSFLIQWITLYQKTIFWLSSRHKGNKIWALSKPRIWQIFRELLLISAILIFAPPVLNYLMEIIQHPLMSPLVILSVFNCLIALTLAIPLFALWRNISATSLLMAEALSRGAPNRAKLSTSLRVVFQGAALIACTSWILFLLPWGYADRYSVLIWIGLLILFICLFQRRLILWHSRFELLLNETLSPNSSNNKTWSSLRDPIEDLNLLLVELDVPDDSPHAGKTIAQLNLRKSHGSTIAGIERQGYLISAPAPDQQVYPNDRLLLLGTSQAIKKSQTYLKLQPSVLVNHSDFNEICLNHTSIQDLASLIGSSLQKLNLTKDHGITVVGIQRDQQLKLNLDSSDCFMKDDTVIFLATPQNFKKFKEFYLNNSIQ